MPALRRIPPMLASTVSDVPEGRDWTFEPKYDGMRVVAHVSADAITLVTRNGIDRAVQFPEVVHALRELYRKRRRPFVLDGEIVVRRAGGDGSAFQALQSRWHVADASAIARHANTTPVDLVAFDLLLEGDEATTPLPWHVRRSRLEKLLAGPPRLGVRLARSARGNAQQWLQRAARLGWEGLMAKRVDAPYRPGVRSRDWRKLKVVHEQEFVVGGWTEPRRSREHLGALLLGYWQDGALIYAGHTGTGFTREVLADLEARLTKLERQTSPFAEAPRTNERARWARPALVVVVRFTEWTADGRLRQPVFIGIRDDKNAADVGREPASMQKKFARTGAARRRAATRSQAATRRKDAPRSRGIVAQLEALENSGARGTLRTGRSATLAVTSLDKVYFPRARLTKGHVMRYYAAIARELLPLIADRPLVLKRYPDGIGRGSAGAFYQQSAPESTPDGVRVQRVRTADGMEPRIVAGDLTTLLYGVQIGAIEVNPWHSRVGSLNHADYLVLDLDPGPRANFARVVQVALWIREVLEEYGFGGAVKTSGGRGMHVYLALPPRTSFKTARTAAELIARHVVAAHPKETTLERTLKRRPPNAVYVDVGQNDRGKSVAAPFSLRAREPGPVSTPLDWSELVPALNPASFTMDTVLPDARRRAQLWRRMLRRPIALERLTEARGSARRRRSSRSAA